MNSPIVILDACVLFPAPLRDFLMHLALLDVVRARWTDEIHAEWIRSVLKTRPDLTEKQLNRTKELMNSHVRDCLVEDYESLIDKLTLPDPNDRHVPSRRDQSRSGNDCDLLIYGIFLPNS